MHNRSTLEGGSRPQSPLDEAASEQPLLLLRPKPPLSSGSDELGDIELGDVELGDDERGGGGQENKEERANFRVLSVVVIALYLLIWICQAELVQVMTTGSLGSGEPYQKPMMICWLNHNVFLLFFPIVFAIKYFVEGTTPWEHVVEWSGRLHPKQALAVYSGVAVLYAFCIWAWVYGLMFISATSSNGLYQLNCIFVVVLSSYVLKEVFTFTKRLGVLLSFLGICLVVVPTMLSDRAEGSADPLKGSVLTVFSAVTCAAYEVAFIYAADLRRGVVGDPRHPSPPPPPPNQHQHPQDQRQGAPQDDEELQELIPEQAEPSSESASSSVATPALTKVAAVVETMTTLGFIGLGNLVFVPPLLVFLHLSGLEVLSLPSTDEQVNLLAVNGFLSFLFDLLFALSIFLSGPVVVSVSSSLIIPLSLIADRLLHGNAIQGRSVAGSLVVVAGLWFLNDEKGRTEAWLKGRWRRWRGVEDKDGREKL